MYRSHGGTRKGCGVAIWRTVVVSGEVDLRKMRRTKIKDEPENGFVESYRCDRCCANDERG